MDALEAYLSELSANRAAGSVPETSGYGALATLLNEIGHKLKPRVRCVVNPANRGAGIPDGGLFVANQFEKGQIEPLPDQLPARGAVEAKAPSADAMLVAQSDQVMRYLAKYRQVLVTTYRQFVLVGYDAEGEAKERFCGHPSCHSKCGFVLDFRGVDIPRETDHLRGGIRSRGRAGGHHSSFRVRGSHARFIDRVGRGNFLLHRGIQQE